jgi:hypothetical protein
MMINKAGYGLQGNVTDANTVQAIAAKINVQGKMPVYNSPTIGDYHKFLKAGTYTVTVSAIGYDAQTFNDVVVTDAAPTILDVQLTSNAGNQSAFKVITTKNFTDNQVPADPGITWNIPGMPDGLYYPLGDAGYIILDLGASIINVSENDLTVTGEASQAGNGYELYCSSLPDEPWTLLGDGETTQSFEIGNIENARYLMVVDNGNGSGNTVGAGFHLDAVTIIQTSVGIEKPVAKFSSFQVYPNPTSNLKHKQKPYEKTKSGITRQDRCKNHFNKKHTWGGFSCRIARQIDEPAVGFGKLLA